MWRGPWKVAPIGAPPPFVFTREVNAFVTILCSTRAQRRAARGFALHPPRFAGKDETAGDMAMASLGIAKIRRRSALILPLALNLIRHVSRWGEHEMRDFMRVSLATGEASLAPAAWDRGV
jgi:hypothetical protein